MQTLTDFEPVNKSRPCLSSAQNESIPVHPEKTTPCNGSHVAQLEPSVHWQAAIHFAKESKECFRQGFEFAYFSLRRLLWHLKTSSTRSGLAHRQEAVQK